MIKKLAKVIVDHQVNNGVLHEREQQTYMLGYQLLIGKLISVVFMVIIAIITGTLAKMLVFMIMFVCLRQYAGGFHFNNTEMCILFSAIICIFVAKGLKSNTGEISALLAAVIEVSVAFIIWHLAPIDTKNKQLDNLEMRVYKKRARVVLCIECIIFMLGIIIGWSDMWIEILLSHLVVAFSLIIVGKNKKISRE